RSSRPLDCPWGRCPCRPPRPRRRAQAKKTERLKRFLAVAVLVAALVPPGADAHFGTGKKGYRSRIIALKPALPGVRTKILYGDDQVWLDNRSGKTIVIKGYDGEPFLRFGPDGIYVNGRSPSVYL